MPGVGDDATDEYAVARAGMVEHQLRRRGLRDPSVLAAMGRVPRHLFVPEAVRHVAYDDRPLPIADGQTISQPYIVAVMIELAAVTSRSRVLEIGTGSGYAAAVLAAVAGEVVSIERHPGLAAGARAALEGTGVRNVAVFVGDGTRGYPDRAPFDAIIATAAGPRIPSSWAEQLVQGGRIVAPVERDDGHQELVRAVVAAGTVREEVALPVAFVPLIGADGFPEPPARRAQTSRTGPASMGTRNNE